MIFYHNQLKMEQIHLLLFQTIRSEEYKPLMEQSVNFLHFHIELLIFQLLDQAFYNYLNLKSTILFENGEILLIDSSKDYIPQTCSSEGVVSEFAPFFLVTKKNHHNRICL